MAQRIVGLNNINLLEPLGQFGSRALGGDDHASARYIYTRLSPIARKLFPEADDHVLTYEIDDGKPVEPKFYVPILPLLLINGSKGIGSGWSTDIPNFNPVDIAKQILRKLDTGADFERLVPFYRGFHGKIEQKEPQKFVSYGEYELDENTDILTISELPVMHWTTKYKVFLEKMMEKEAVIHDFIEDHRLGRVHFQIRLFNSYTRKMDSEAKIRNVFKLYQNINLTNMVVFNENSRLVKCETEIEILDRFYDIRLECYKKRKIYLLSLIERDCDLLQNKIRFIKMVIEDELVLRKRKLEDIVKDLIQHQFKPMSRLKPIKSTKVRKSDKKKGIIIEEENEDGDGEDEGDEENGKIILNYIELLLC